MQSQRNHVFAEIEFTSVAQIDVILQRLAAAGVIAKETLDDGCYKYNLVGGHNLSHYFIVDITGRTYFKLDFAAAIQSRNVGILPKHPLLTSDKSQVKARDYRNHENKLVYNEVLAEMLLQARFQVASEGKIDPNLPNKLVDITRPACKESGKNVLFPCGFKLDSVLERMLFYREPINLAAQSLISLYYQEQFNHLQDLSQAMAMNPTANHGINQQNMAEIEAIKMELLTELEAFKQHLEQETIRFNTSAQSFQSAIKKHRAQAFTPLEAVKRKCQNAKGNISDAKFFFAGSLFPVLFPFFFTTGAVMFFKGIRDRDQYQPIYDYRSIAENNGALLPTNADKHDAATLTALGKVHKGQGYRLDVDNIVRPAEVLQHINDRIAELTIYINYLKAPVVEVAITPTGFTRSIHGFYSPDSPGSSNGASQSSNAIIPRSPKQ